MGAVNKGELKAEDIEWKKHEFLDLAKQHDWAGVRTDLEVPLLEGGQVEAPPSFCHLARLALLFALVAAAHGAAAHGAGAAGRSGLRGLRALRAQGPGGAGLQLAEEPEAMCEEGWAGFFWGGMLDLCVVWPVGIMIRKKVSYAVSVSSGTQFLSPFLPRRNAAAFITLQHNVRELCALPSFIGLSAWLVMGYFQDGTLACWPWPQAVLVCAAGGLALQTLNFLFPYRTHGYNLR